MQASDSLSILFAGTPDFAVPALQGLIQEGYSPVAVLTQPDRPAGRGRQLQASPVKQVAADYGIAVHQPATLRNPEARELIAGLQPDLMIVVAYGLLLPREIIELPTHGCWNIHASLLPHWRGAAPIQRAIEAGDEESGVCIMQMDEGLDTGPVIHRLSMPLTGTETAGALHDRLAEAGAEALLECVHRLARGEQLTAQPQAADGVSYAAKLQKSEAQIHWRESAEVLERRIRAFNPWPVAWCTIAGERTRIWKACWLPQSHGREAGAVLAAGKQGIDVAAGEHVLRLLELQRPGKRRMSAADYINARQLPPSLDEDPRGVTS